MSNTLTVKSIVAAYLRANGYDGLYNEDCGCLLADDLMPCSQEEIGECRAGYRGPCTCGAGCEWRVGPATEPRVPGQRLVTVMCGQAEQERLEAAVVEAAVANKITYQRATSGGLGWQRYMTAFEAEEEAVAALIAFRTAGNE